MQRSRCCPSHAGCIRASPHNPKKNPPGFFLSALGRRWHPAHPNGDRAAYLRRGRRPGPHYQRPQPHHSPRLGLSGLCRAGGGQRDEPWAGCPAGLSQRGLRDGGGTRGEGVRAAPSPSGAHTQRDARAAERHPRVLRVIWGPSGCPVGSGGTGVPSIWASLSAPSPIWGRLCCV